MIRKSAFLVCLDAIKRPTPKALRDRPSNATPLCLDSFSGGVGLLPDMLKKKDLGRRGGWEILFKRQSISDDP